MTSYMVQWQSAEQFIKNASPNGDEMLLNGKAPLPGQIMTFPYLAKTFRDVAEHGKDGFYKGRIAEAIVELIQSAGGVMEPEDLAKHESTIVEPIKYTYGSDVTVYEVSFPMTHRGSIAYPTSFSVLQMARVRTSIVPQ
jgi:gamma-glutamyltranspeptidase / glutathione hydrolase